MWQATALGGRKIGLVPALGGGVFANSLEDVRWACVLAYDAYVASGGPAEVSMVLWSPDGSEPKDMQEWKDAANDSPPEFLDKRLCAALIKDESLLLSNIPPARTTHELTTLLKESTDPKAQEFLEKCQDKALVK